MSEYGWPRYLQAIELQGDLGYSHGFGGGSSDEIFFDPVVDYSMPYLGYSTGIRTPWPMRNLCVFTELNFSQLLSGGGDGSLSMFATPGVAYISETYQATVGVQLPLTKAAEKSAQDGVGGIFHNFYGPAQSQVWLDTFLTLPYPRAVPGLFAAGECGAGLHGANRLGGNSLSDLLVFGKRAGAFGRSLRPRAILRPHRRPPG